MCECPEEEVPSPWRRAHREPAEGEDKPPSCLDAGTVEAFGADGGGGGGGAYGGVTLGDLADADASVEPGFLAWAEDASNPWTAEYDSGAGRGGGDGAPGNAQYINLLLNPERFTGYAGPSAAKVWGAIYDENCFLEGGSGVPEEMAGADECVERRVFYRLISGLHASISTHIAGEYPMTYDGPDVVEWGPNADDFFTRVRRRRCAAAAAMACSARRAPRSSARKHARSDARDLAPPSLLFARAASLAPRRHSQVGYHPKRVENLYFAFLFVLRAATKAAPLLERASFDTGNAIDDTRTTELVRALVRSPELAAACPLPFDEATLWRDDAGGALREQLRARFANISAVMDCVGCEKCKVWGKLQVLGLGTALKILFANDDLGASELTLQRNEVIALFNTLERFSKSIMTLQHFLVERYGADEGAPSDEGEEGSREARGMGMEHGHLAGHLSPSKSPTRARAPPPAFMAHGDEL